MDPEEVSRERQHTQGVEPAETGSATGEGRAGEEREGVSGEGPETEWTHGAV